MPRKATPTIAQAATEFLAARQPKIGKDTFYHYKSVLRMISDHIGPDRRMGLIRPSDVEGWFIQLIEEDKEPGTYNAYRVKINVFHRWSVERGYTKHEWLKDVEPEKLFRKDWLQLDPDQILALIKTEGHHPRDRVLLAIAANTALRINEIIKLRVKDLDLWNQKLRVKVSKQRSRRERIEYPPLTADLMEELGVWLDYYEKSVGPLDPNWYLAPAKSRDYLSYDRTVRRYHANSGSLRPTNMIQQPAPLARKSFQRAGLVVPEGQAWHVLRRSVARIYFDSEMDEGATYAHALRRTAALLNHSSTATTEKYLGLDVDRAALSADLAGKPFLSRLSTSGKITYQLSE